MKAIALRRPTTARAQSDRATFTAWAGGPFLISTRPPGATQKWLAGALAAVLFAAFIAAVAFRDSQLPRQDAYVPIANTIVCLNDLLTAALLYAQFSITRKRALLVLASGFLCKALILVPHGLTFPGALAPSGLLGAQLQTTAWLYLSQHLVFLLAAIAYTILSDRQNAAAADDRHPAIPIVASAGAVAAGVLCVTWLVTAGAARLPPIMADAWNTSAAFRHVGSPLLVLLGLASIVVFRRRPTSMVDLWLQVAIWSWLFETLLTAMVRTRFSLVFYVSRTMGVVSSSFVLLVFLSESLMLHRHLVLSMTARKQEQEGHRTAMDVMLGSLAHELRQPLASILANETAAVQMLAASPPDLDDVRAAFDDIHASVVRANEIIESVRAMLVVSPHDRVPIDPNDLVREAVEMVRIEAEAYGIAIDFELSPGLPPISGNRSQLLQVVLNGLKNGIESLAGLSDRARQLRIRTAPLRPDGVSISIEDSGGGLDVTERDRLFEPFYSTKPNGMGLGLSICESIVTAHGGRVSLLPGSPNGAVFRVELPSAHAADSSRGEPSRPKAPGSFVEARAPVASVGAPVATTDRSHPS
jgi:signal transduction histidine kinase